MTDVTIRLWIEGKLCDEVDGPLGVGLTYLIGQAGARHGDMVKAAQSEGLAWMVEFEFADGEQVRWGTDANGMVEPVPIDDLAEALDRRFNPSP